MMDLLFITISTEDLQRKFITEKKDRMKEKIHIDRGRWGTERLRQCKSLWTYSNVQKKSGRRTVGNKKQTISVKKCKDGNEQYCNEKEDEETLFIDEIEAEDDFDVLDFETIMEEIVSQYNEEITYLEPAFNDLTVNTFVLVDNIRGVHVKYITPTFARSTKLLEMV